MERADSTVEYQRFRDAAADIHNHTSKAVDAVFTAAMFGLATLLFKAGNGLIIAHDHVMNKPPKEETNGKATCAWQV
jgi:hypothetical protein